MKDRAKLMKITGARMKFLKILMLLGSSPGKMTELPGLKAKTDFNIPNVVCYELSTKELEIVLFMRGVLSQNRSKRFQLFSIFLEPSGRCWVGRTC